MLLAISVKTAACATTSTLEMTRDVVGQFTGSE
jgi:hypothetical protein